MLDNEIILHVIHPHVHVHPRLHQELYCAKRECIGTKYYQRQMLGWHKELTPKELPEVLFQTYIYRLVNKKLTFQRFGRIWHKVLPEADARAA